MTCTEAYKEHIEYTFHAFCKIVIRNAKDVQKRLGHADINTALQVYTHATEKMAKRSVEIFEKAASL